MFLAIASLNFMASAMPPSAMQGRPLLCVQAMHRQQIGRPIIANSVHLQILAAHSAVKRSADPFCCGLLGCAYSRRCRACATTPAHHVADKLEAIIEANHLWLATPFNQPIQSAQNTERRQGKINLCAKTLADMIIEHAKCPHHAPVHRLS